jgi:RimJ/RimL family protein N-acetyltransferase
MDTEKEKDDFGKFWLSYLSMLKTIAFDELKMHKLFTYAFDVRPHLYAAVEQAGFYKEAVLKEHCQFEGQWKDVVIHSYLNPDIEIRQVVMTDSETLFTWANDENTRIFSFNPDKINFQEHESWLRKKLDDDNALLYMCTVKQEPAAFLRFDKSGNDWIIGINISPVFRNKKLADLFLRKAVNEIREGRFILAYIKCENTASVRTFEKAGFSYEGETTFSGHPALLYKYTLDEK